MKKLLSYRESLPASLACARGIISWAIGGAAEGPHVAVAGAIGGAVGAALDAC